MKKIILICTFVFVGLFINNQFAFSQGTNSDISKDVIAQVSIGNAKLNHFDRNSIITFSIKNYGSAVSGIKTSIILLSEDLSKVLDQRVISESISLASGEDRSVVYSYGIPESFSGTYRLGIRAQTESNLPLGTFIFPDKVATKSASEGLYIDQSSCFLKVVGESADKKYNLEQGVDVLPSEKLVLSCTAKNLDKKLVESKLISNTYLRSLAGKIISGPVSGDVVKFGVSEIKKIEVPIVLPSESQAYDTFVRLETVNGQASNEIRAHFVVRGESATVQNVSLDKVSYIRGDIAVLILNWTPSADSFPGSRVGKGTSLVEPKAIVSLLSGDKLCAKETSIPLTSDIFKVTSSIKIDRNCADVVARVKIVSGDKELYSSDYNVPSGENKASSGLTKIVLGVLALITLVGIGMIIKNKKAKVVTTLLILLSFSFLGLNEVNADTVSWKDKGNNTLTGTINMVRDWNVGDDISFSGDFSNTYQWCGNGATKKITLGYQVLDSTGAQISSKTKINGPMISESLGTLAAGDYTLRTFFGDSVEYVVGSYVAGLCLVMVDEYIDTDYSPYFEIVSVPNGDTYDCQIPVYVLGPLSGIESLDIPFKVNSSSNPPKGNLTCTGDPNTYKWEIEIGACDYNYIPTYYECGYDYYNNEAYYREEAMAPASVVCKRQSDNQNVADSLCEASIKPNPGGSYVCDTRCGI